MAYTKYSLTPANNTAAPPDGAPEGMLPSAVNDTMRDMMAQIRDAGDGIRDGTYTMTAPKITGGTITGATLTGNTFTSPVISGGSINNTPIGATTANTGAFTTLSATGATTFSGATVVSGSLTANTFSSSGATITGGTINGTTVGATTPSTVKTTALTVTGATSGTLAIEATAVAGTNTATFPAATGTVMVSGNMPAFSAYMSANQSISSATWTKAQLNTEVFDTNSNFDPTTNYRFTPTVEGYYQINAGIYCSNTTEYDTQGSVAIYKNGSIYHRATLNFGGEGSKFNDFLTAVSGVIYLNGSTDYIELYGRITAGGTPQIVGGTTYDSFMNGCLLRRA